MPLLWGEGHVLKGFKTFNFQTLLINTWISWKTDSIPLTQVRLPSRNTSNISVFWNIMSLHDIKYDDILILDALSMAMQGNANLTDVYLKLDNIENVLVSQRLTIDRILSVLLVLESKTLGSGSINYMPIPQAPYITEIETFPKN